MYESDGTAAGVVVDEGSATTIEGRAPEADVYFGVAVEHKGIRSSLGPFHFLPQYQVRYPEVVVRALGDLYGEYNEAFRSLVAANREWNEDYQLCHLGSSLVNFGVQVDMVGLTPEFLATSTSLSQDEVREQLRRMVFEFENSLAMYQLLERIFSRTGEETFFRRRFRATLEGLRQQFGRPIALLAVTDQKYQAMRESEFGKSGDEPLSDEEVRELSGFDRFFSPQAFREHLEGRGGKCDYLLYARTSDPVAKLKNPSLEVEHPLLGDPDIRRVVKANTLTMNVDAPGMEYSRLINDSKAWMSDVGMAYNINDDRDLCSPAFRDFLENEMKKKGRPYGDFVGESRLSSGFLAYLASYGVSGSQVESGQVALRCKPAKGTYGCYGHVSGSFADRFFRKELRLQLGKRGSYVVQPELILPTIRNVAGHEYGFIDRVFLSSVGGKTEFLGGFRSFMPLNSTEAHERRNHGSKVTVWAEIQG